jgi:hypothetical protein
MAAEDALLPIESEMPYSLHLAACCLVRTHMPALVLLGPAMFFLRLTPASTSAVVDERGHDQGCSVACPFLCSDVNVIVAVMFLFAFISGCYCHRIWPSRPSDAPAVPCCTRHVIRYTPESSLNYALHPPTVTKLKWLTVLYSDILHRIVLEFDNKCGKNDGRTDGQTRVGVLLSLATTCVRGCCG